MDSEVSDLFLVMINITPIVISVVDQKVYIGEFLKTSSPLSPISPSTTSSSSW